MAGQDVVSLMVLPPLVPDTPPQILMESDGVWRDMSPAGGMRSEVSVKQTKEQIDRLLGLVMKDVENGTPLSGRGKNLTSKFGDLYEDLLPQSVRDELFAKSPQQPADAADVPTLLIHLHPQSEWVPWEMLHDGDNYLGLKWQIARLPIVSKNVNPNLRQPHLVQTIYSLLGRNVLDPSEVQLLADWQNTFAGRPQEWRVPPPGSINYPDVDVIAGARDVDILHITCHGGIKNDEGEFVWTLDHRGSELSYHITQTMVSRLTLRSRPLVFGNACASAAADANGDQRGLLPAFGASFFAQGALNFVGTFAPVTKVVAVEFARLFYAHLFGPGGQPGEGIGRALWKTKADFFARDLLGAPGKPDLSYLFYCLYGLPDTMYQI